MNLKYLKHRVLTCDNYQDTRNNCKMILLVTMTDVQFSKYRTVCKHTD